MGDAGPLTPPSALERDRNSLNDESGNNEHETPLREVTVLVTGFGPFKSFPTNPSWLIASSLPATLQPQEQSPIPSTSTTTTLADLKKLQERQKKPLYTIRLVTHPSPVRVSYATVAALLPQLISTHDPDYIVHMGMAGGRDHYTLETQAHRDNYKIKDVDERDGWREGEHAWRGEGVPEMLPVGWDEVDVLARWEREVWEVEERMGLLDGVKGREGKSVVRLSRDAGRFLCEFALMASLSRRWLEARGTEGEFKDTGSREGKVAFFHVPGGYSADDISRGVRVAEAVIRSLVGSWEDGKRREEGGGTAVAAVERGRWEGVVWRA